MGTWRFWVRKDKKGAKYPWTGPTDPVAVGVNAYTTGSQVVGFTTAAAPATDALLWTPAQLTAMRARWAAQDTYWAAGDVSVNSPGDGSRINANADAFRAGTTQPWNPGTAPIAKGESDAATEGRLAGFNMRDCAFRYLMTQDTADRDAVKAHLLVELRQPWMDVSNADWWAQGGSNYIDDNPLFTLSHLWSRYLYAFAFLGDGAFTAAEITEVQGVLEAAAHFMIAEYNHPGYLNLFTDRAAGTITATANSFGSDETYFGGPELPHIALWVNNRRMSMNGFVGLVAAQWGDTTLITAAKNMVIDWLRFGVMPAGVLSDFYRDLAGWPSLGWAYSGSCIFSCLETARALQAKRADTALFDHATTIGASFGPTAGAMDDGTSDDGQPKSLLQATKILAKYVDGNVYDRYSTDDGGQINGDPFVREAYAAVGNIHWQDPYLHGIVNRTATGVSGWHSATDENYEGAGRNLPGVLFMFGGI